jgi:hypothetical protein
MSNLEGWELIDVYLRREFENPNWARRVGERNKYGFVPDFYEATSKRDAMMKMVIDLYISEFIQIISKEECISLYEPPDHNKETLAELYLIH